MDFIQSLLLAVIPSSISLLLGYFISGRQEARKKITVDEKKRIEKDEFNDNIHMLLLHELILNRSEKLLKQSSISMQEYEDLLLLNEPYMKLGGNGTAKAAIKQVANKMGIN